MRNTTTPLVIGGIFLLFLIYAGLSSNTTTSNPALQAATTFLQAVNDNDFATLERVSQPGTVKFARSGSVLSGIRFEETTPFKGAFSQLSGVVWGYTELTNLAVGKDVFPVVSGDLGIATVETTNKSNIYLRLNETDHTWRVYYIAKPKPGK